MEQDLTSQPAASGATGGTETPDAGAQAASDANPFPWDAAGFGKPSSAAAVSEPPAPTEHPTAEAEKPAGVTPDGTPADAPADGKVAAESGAPATEPSKPEDAATPEAQPSRRQAARAEAEQTIQAQQAQIEQAVADALKARDEAEAAKAALAARERADQEAVARLADLRGDDAEYNRRLAISARMFDPMYTGPKLTDEEATDLAKWAAIRELQQPFEHSAQRSAAAWVDGEIDKQRNTWVTQAMSVADEIGLPRAELGKRENANLGVLLKLTATTVETRIREAEVKPLQDKVSQLEATVRTKDDQLVHAQRSPVIGGRSDGGVVPGTGSGWDPALGWDANFNRPQAPAEATA